MADEISSWQNGKLTKWQVDKMASWKWQVENGKLKMTSWKWQVENGNLMKQQVVKMGNWWNDKFINWQIG